MENTCKVKTLTRKPDWIVTVPGSKSMTNRALLIAALADGKSLLKGVLFSDDSRHFLSSLQSLGFNIEINEQAKEVVVIGLNGALPVTSARISNPTASSGVVDSRGIRQMSPAEPLGSLPAEINVGSAGTAARFLTAMLALSNGTFTVNASEQMKKRPMKPLFDVLIQMGADIEYLENEGFLPIKICGIAAKGTECKMRRIKLDISESTQFLSALMLISPMVKQGLHIEITSERKDGSYIRITRKMMAQFGASTEFDGTNYIMQSGISYKAGTYRIEPDVSAACYFYAAAALTGGRVIVKNVTWECMQGDLKFISLLEKLGCAVKDTETGIEVTGADNGRINGITVDMKDFSDQAMTLAAIAPFADADVRIENVGHIRLQECDRLHAIACELTKLGIKCEEEADAITIHPGIPKAGIVDTYDDHRVAMSFALIGLRIPGIEIDNPMCCKKTFEEYFEVLDGLCAE